MGCNLDFVLADNPGRHKMSFISEINPESWKNLIDKTEPDRPSVGKRVRITSGKHVGKEGIVTWHGVNKFSNSWRYCTDAQVHLRTLIGREGFRIRVNTGDEVFFVDADKVIVTGGGE